MSYFRAENLSLHFGGLKAVDAVSFAVEKGEILSIIGPNGAGKSSIFNLISRIYPPTSGRIFFEDQDITHEPAYDIARLGIARTFQTPRVIGEASVLENVMIGGSIEGRANFVEAMLALPRNGVDERLLAAKARALLGVVGLEALADVRADRLQHSELRFIEIARALMLDPDFLLLDEPAAGLSNDEIGRLATLIKAVCGRGTGVLLVEHHADLIFDICHQVTVLNLGRTLAAGTPAEIRVHKEVVSAYLGG